MSNQRHATWSVRIPRFPAFRTTSSGVYGAYATINQLISCSNEHRSTSRHTQRFHRVLKTPPVNFIRTLSSPPMTSLAPNPFTATPLSKPRRVDGWNTTSIFEFGFVVDSGSWRDRDR